MQMAVLLDDFEKANEMFPVEWVPMSAGAASGRFTIKCL